ncbi:hypothetical protein PNA2_1481 [Pyrococcus sp. NA2]|uniref:hypothetical protein n=1 Tax=Pyrococcus sp. (strain NA2) TaxID=342949 RepID=UPI000209AFA8|nr:hypothetical protein [Pyrococcus sp. NA2]AEC52396.1 hypothetical protein PNA2_1481 [Pyrococcus sp. NA2]
MNFSTIILIIMVLAAVSTLQFYKGRKLNLLLMQHYLRSVEDILKPVDKEYIWLGGYVGFRAYYKLRDKDVLKFEYTLTLLPRQSILYFPISLLISRHDKMYVVIRPTFEVKREVHFLQKGYFRIKPRIEREVELLKGEEEVNGVKFEVLYEKRRDIEIVKNSLEKFPKIKNIKHVAIVPKTNVIYFFFKPEPETIDEYVNKMIRLVKELARNR